MLRVACFLLSLIAIGVGYPYNPHCQNWCYGGQQSFVEPQLCSSYCGGYSTGYSGNYGASSSCCSGGSSQYPVAYAGSPVGPISWPGYGYGYNYGQYQYPTGQSQYPTGQYQYPTGQYQYPTNQLQYPSNQGSYIFADPNSIVPQNNDPIRITVDSNPQKPKEWVCPADPSPRVGSNYPTQQETAGPVHCRYDENCPNHPYRQKCCHDNAIGAKVCKPAVLV